MKVVVVYLDGVYPKTCVHCAYNVLSMLKVGVEEIHTTFTGALNLEFIECGYKIFFVWRGVEYECRIGSNDWTQKDIRVAHNVEKMVRAMVYGEVMNEG